MPSKIDMGDHYVIYGYTPEPQKIAKSALTPELSANLAALPDAPGAPAAPPPVAAPPATESVTQSTIVSNPKYAPSGGLSGLAGRAQAQGADLQGAGVAPLPARPSLSQVREQAAAYPTGPEPQVTAEGGIDFTGVEPEVGLQVEGDSAQVTERRDPLFVNEQERIQSQLRAQQFEAQQAEESRRLEMAAQQEELKELQNDVRSYKIDPQYFWSGRPKHAGRSREELEALAIEEARESGQGIDDQAIKSRVEEMREETEGGRSTLNKLGLIISSALVSYASAKQGGDPAAGIKLLDRFINLHVNRQQAELARRTGVARSQANLLGEMRSKFKDERAAELQTRAFLSQSLATEMARVQQHVTDAEKQQRLDLMIKDQTLKSQQLSMQAQNLELQSRKAIAERVYRNEVLGLQRDQAAIKRAEKQQELLVPGMTFSGEKLPTKKDAELMNKGRAETVKVVSMIDDLVDYVYSKEGVGWQAIPTKEAALAKRKLREIQLRLKGPEMANLGVLTGPDLQLLEEVTTQDPTGFWQEENRLKIQDLRDRVISGFVDSARQRGYIDTELAPVRGFTPSR